MPSAEESTQAMCKEIQEKYSSCDVRLLNASKICSKANTSTISDALLVLKVPSAGYLPDMAPTPHENSPARRIVAPISTILFVPKSYQRDRSGATDNPVTHIPAESNLPADKHWTDVPEPGTIALLQQPPGQIVAILGDIIATRFKVRGLAGAIVDGRIRDVAGCGSLCADGTFAVWSKGLSTVGTSLEAKPWAVDVPMKIGGVVVRPGDFAVLDEAEKGIVVIPKDKLAEVAELLPGLKKADDAVLREVQAGVGVKEAFQKHRGHYVHRQ